jgi:chromatin remodeling complex protein RSC6
MPSTRTTRTCATPFRTAETSSIPWGTADPSNLYRLPHHEEDLENLDNPNSRRGEEEEPSHSSTEKSMSSSADMGRKKARGNKSSTTVRYWWQLLDLPPRIDGPSTLSPSLGRISGSTLTTRASTRSSSIL